MGFLAKLFGQKNKQTIPKMTPDLATQVIQKYGDVMQNSAPSPGCVADITCLPFPKDQIKQALVIALKSNDDLQIQEHLKIAYLQLADWQEGVGNTPAGLDLSHVDIESNLEEIAKSILENSDQNSKWGQIIIAEQDKLKQELINLGFWSKNS